MRKILKPLLITLASIILLIGLGVGYALWFVFTPEKLSPVVNRQLTNFFTCEVNMGAVDITFFSTFPSFGVQLTDFSLVNPMENALSDTLLRVEKLVGRFDLTAFRRNNEILLSDLSIHNGVMNAFIDSLGRTNFDVMVPDTSSVAKDNSSGGDLGFIDIGTVDLRNVSLTFIDDSLKMNAAILGIDAQFTGIIDQNNITSNVNLKKSSISFAFENEQYLDNALISLIMPVKVHNLGQIIDFGKSTAVINDLRLMFEGLLEMDTINGDMRPTFDFALEKWPYTIVRAMVPPSFEEYFEGLQMDGLISSTGKISGVFNDSLMPLIDINLVIENGAVDYVDFPLPLREMAGNINIYTDMTNDDISYVRLNSFSAKTPNSDFSVKGTITRILSDMHLDLRSQGNFLLDEFAPLIPDTLDMQLKGRVKGWVNSEFTMSQLDNMVIDRMKLSGDLTGNNLDITYDSLWVKTDVTDFQFVMPNPNASSADTRFLLASVNAHNFETGFIDFYDAYLKNASITLETSNLMDTTRLPDVMASFVIDSVAAVMDTMRLALDRPTGSAAVSAYQGNSDMMHLKLQYQGDALNAFMGKDSVIVGRIIVDTEVINDDKQQDVFLQWLAKGFVDMEEGLITTSYLSHPLVIPAIKMDFEPEKFNIRESRLIIDKSDFELSGILSNILSWFRGDSLLRGEFLFTSDNTDILQLMDLTSGLGSDEKSDTTKTQQAEAVTEKSATASDTLYSDPYMVPKGMDLLLAANIKKATFGVDTAMNISGNVRVADGILLLDELAFTTSAARFQMTAMYRTPRKNHLYLGLDYHMFDVEIERLLQIIPDIDTLMPMLRSFSGKGEFHLAVETYLDSMYNVKPSTLRGSASIQGQDLVLMDGETFGEIAKTLRFSKKAENRVDSLSAEFTIFREEIDIYPFLMVMDRYKAVVGGRHNFDMSFDYHISLIESPLPVRLGVDVKGDLDNMRYTPASVKYPEFYRPQSRRAVQSKQLELRRLIRESITERVGG
jgi:hypothetical protein